MVLTNTNGYYSRIIEARNYDKKPLISPKIQLQDDRPASSIRPQPTQKATELHQPKKTDSHLLHRPIRKTRHINSDRTPKKLSVYYRYVVTINNANQTQKMAREKGIMCEKPVWKLLHQSLRRFKCLTTDYVHTHALSIPLYPSLSHEETEEITKSLTSTFRSLPSQ